MHCGSYGEQDRIGKTFRISPRRYLGTEIKINV